MPPNCSNALFKEKHKQTNKQTKTNYKRSFHFYRFWPTTLAPNCCSIVDPFSVLPLSSTITISFAGKK